MDFLKLNLCPAIGKFTKVISALQVATFLLLLIIFGTSGVSFLSLTDDAMKVGDKVRAIHEVSGPVSDEAQYHSLVQMAKLPLGTS